MNNWTMMFERSSLLLWALAAPMAIDSNFVAAEFRASGEVVRTSHGAIAWSEHTQKHAIREPCAIVPQMVTYVHGGESTRVGCQLRGADTDVHGAVLLTIEGLTASWMTEKNAWPNSHSLHTLFLPGAMIDTDNYALELPPGESVDTMEMGTVSTLPDVRVDALEGRRRRLSDPDAFGAGEKSFWIVRMDFTDSQAPSTEAIIDNVLNGGPSFAEQLEAMSFGKLTMAPPNIESVPNGIFTLSFNANVGQLPAGAIENAATQFLQQTLQVFDVLDHFLYILPYGSIFDESTEWLAFATLPGKVSVFNGVDGNPDLHWSYATNTVVHELGHNFCLGHSNENDDEYHDVSGAMGFANVGGVLSQDEVKGYNGAKSWVLGWYADQTIELVATEEMSRTTRLCGVVDYDPSDTSYVVLIRLDDPNSVLNYYVAFNRAIGFNAESSEGRNQVLVTSAFDPGAQPSEFSNLEAKLRAGETHIVDEAESALSGTSITVVNIDDESSEQMCATVSITTSISSSPTAAPSSSSAPTTTAQPTGIPTGEPTLGACRNWSFTNLPLRFLDTNAVSYRFDIVITDTTEINGMRLILPFSTPQEYTIFFRPSTWQADGPWTEIASGTILPRGDEELTDVISFDQVLELSESDELASFRIDTPNRVLQLGATSIGPHPPTFFECQNCPFTVNTGLMTGVTGDAPPPPLFEGFFDFFLGSLEFCNGESQMPSSTPSMMPSTHPTITASVNPSATPSTHPSSNPSATPSTHPSSNPTVSPSTHPSSNPSATPSIRPSTAPSTSPSANPSNMPSLAPSYEPSVPPTSEVGKQAKAPKGGSEKSDKAAKPSKSDKSDKSETPSKTPKTMKASKDESKSVKGVSVVIDDVGDTHTDKTNQKGSKTTKLTKKTQNGDDGKMENKLQREEQWR